MKIDVNRIPPEGLILAEEIAPAALDLDTEIIKFSAPLRVKAKINKITNAVTVRLNLKAEMSASCSRCLNDFKIDFNKDVQLNFQADNSITLIDLDPDIREEIILDYPINPLCVFDCKGLCPKCGKNLNQGGFICGST